MKLLYEFIKGEKKEHLWREKVEVYDDKKTKYSIFLPFPICKDGSKHEVCEELEKKGWKCEKNGGLKYGGLIYKEGLTYPEVINFIYYIKVYKKTYDFLTEQSPYVDIPLKITKFFGIVDVKMNMERKYGRYSLSLKKISWVNLVEFLRKEGFTLVST